jgi:membrane protein DedA with SNARE-associated domain
MHVAQEVTHFVEPYLAHYGVLAIFVVIYLESLGAPLPGESALVAASLLVAHGDIALVPLLVAAWSGAVAGDSTGYLIGRIGGRPLLQRFGPYLKLTPDRLKSFEDLFRRRGAFIVFGARFVVILRQLNGIIAGSMSMPWPHFLVANALGGAAWVAVYVLGPYLFADLFAWSGLGRKL